MLIKRIVRNAVLVLLISVLVGCTMPVTTPTPVAGPQAEPTATALSATQVPEAPTAEAPALEVVWPTETKSFSLAELQALPPTEGYGGILSSTGEITPPALFKGVAVKDILETTGAFDETMGVAVVANDGYSITFSYDQVMNGAFVAYDPGTGKELASHDPLTAIVAYEREGEPLDPKQDGTLRLVVVSEKPNQIVDGHWSVKWVSQLVIKSLAEEWTLHLEGAVSEDMDRATFESGAAPSCHGAIWEDEKAQKWAGIPLWLLVGRVDDEIVHQGPAFNDELVETGYTVDVVAKDGYTVTFDAARIARNDNIIVAYLVNDTPLPEDYFPLRLVGDDLEKNEMIGMIEKIVVHLAPVGEATVEQPTPTAEPKPTAAEAEQAAGGITIQGLVATTLSLTQDDLRAMEVVELTLEHPKNGAQKYEGVRLNALLDEAGVKPEAGRLILTAADGYAVEVPLEEVRACTDCLVAFTDEPDTLQLAMPGMSSSAWVKGIATVDVQ